MFKRDIKKQFNENKYNLLTQKGSISILNYFNSRCTSEIIAFQGPIPKVACRLPCLDGSWIQLLQEILHFPSSSQVRVKAYDSS